MQRLRQGACARLSGFRREDAARPCTFSLTRLLLAGGRAGAAGSAAAKSGTHAVGNCGGNGCDARVRRLTARVGLLRHTQALRGARQKDRHHLPSRVPHELPGLQRPLLADI